MVLGFLLLLSLPAHAAVRLDTHPLMPIVADNAGLRQGIAAQLQLLPESAIGSEEVQRFDMARPEDDARSIEARKMALAMAVNKDALPQGALSELLGPKGARGIEALAADELLMARNQSMSDLADEAGVERLRLRLAELFDAARERHDVHSDFVPESTAVSKLEGAIVERGTHHERPAVTLTLPDGSRILAVKVGSARTWDEARNLARQRERQWDLPTEDEMQALVRSGALDVRIPTGPDHPGGLNPLWTRSSREAENAHLSGTSQAVALFDNAPGGGIGLIDVGPQAVARIKGELEKLRESIDAAQARAHVWRLEKMLAAIEHGYPVWTVTAKQGFSAPPSAAAARPDRRKLH